jgi:hypothetical protein
MMGGIVIPTVYGCLSKNSFNSAVQSEVKNIALFEKEEDVMNLNRQFLELVERDGKYRTSPYHQSNTIDSLRFASEIMIKDEETWKSNIERLNVDGSQ